MAAVIYQHPSYLPIVLSQYQQAIIVNLSIVIHHKLTS